MAKMFLLLTIVATSYMLCGVCNAWEVVNSVSNGYKYVTASTNYLYGASGVQMHTYVSAPALEPGSVIPDS